VRQYSDAEQALILHRLVQPYNCGDIDIVSSKKTTHESRSAPTKSHVTSATARSKLTGKGGRTSNSSSSELKKQNESTSSKINTTTGDKKSGIGTLKKTADSAGGKGFKTKRYALCMSHLDEDYDWVKKCMEYEVEGARPRGRPKKTWTKIVQKDCQAPKLNSEDAMDHNRWRKQIRDD